MSFAEDAHMPERLCTITGGKEGVEAAVQRIQEIIQNVQERDGKRANCYSLCFLCVCFMFIIKLHK